MKHQMIILKYGEANWFFKTDCTIAPLAAREPPTINASNTLGNLKFHIIDTCLGSIPSSNGTLKNLLANIEKVSNMLILELPKEVPIHIANNTNGIDKINNILFL